MDKIIERILDNKQLSMPLRFIVISWLDSIWKNFNLFIKRLQFSFLRFESADITAADDWDLWLIVLRQILTAIFYVITTIMMMNRGRGGRQSVVEN